MMSENIKTVLDVLQAETDGDVERGLKLLDKDYSMTWVYKDRKGKLFPRTEPGLKEVREEMNEVYKIKNRKYEIKNITEGKDIVMIEMIESYPDPKTRKIYRTPQVIVLEMKSGKIKRGRHYCDPRLSYLNLKPREIKRIFK